MSHKCGDTAFVLEYIFFAAALVKQDNAHTRVQKRKLAQPFGEDIVVERRITEDVGTGFEVYLGAGICCLTGHLKRFFRTPQ